MMLLSFSMNAQLPQAFSFQGMAMDANGNLVTNADISLEVGILEGGISGSAVYTESATVSTSSLGHFTLEIGRGTASFGAFDEIITIIQLQQLESGACSVDQTVCFCHIGII